jgi:hypothetical protein
MKEERRKEEGGRMREDKKRMGKNEGWRRKIGGDRGWRKSKKYEEGRRAGRVIILFNTHTRAKVT